MSQTQNQRENLEFINAHSPSPHNPIRNVVVSHYFCWNTRSWKLLEFHSGSVPHVPGGLSQSINPRSLFALRLPRVVPLQNTHSFHSESLETTGVFAPPLSASEGWSAPRWVDLSILLNTLSFCGRTFVFFQKLFCRFFKLVHYL